MVSTPWSPVLEGPNPPATTEFNETVLQTDSEVHRLAPHFAAVIAEEARELTTRAAESRQLDSSQFMTVWWRVVRRLAFGDAARDDEEITDQLLRLRKAGNWSFLALPHYRERSRFLDHLYRYAEDPQPGTLVSAVGETRAPGGVDQVGQMPQWLFAFDAAGMASLRAWRCWQAIPRS